MYCALPHLRGVAWRCLDHQPISFEQASGAAKYMLKKLRTLGAEDSSCRAPAGTQHTFVRLHRGSVLFEPCAATPGSPRQAPASFQRLNPFRCRLKWVLKVGVSSHRCTVRNSKLILLIGLELCQLVPDGLSHQVGLA